MIMRYRYTFLMMSGYVREFKPLLPHRQVMSSADAAEVIQETTLATVLERVPAFVQAIHKPSLAQLLSSCQGIRQHLHSILTGVHVQQASVTPQ